MSRADDTRFDSWKEIAAYLGRDLRTVRRWEEERDLPVHRVPGGGRAAVYAYRSKIDTWLRNTHPNHLTDKPILPALVSEGQPPANPEVAVRHIWNRGRLVLLGAVSIVALFAMALGVKEPRTRIDRVSPIHASTDQTIVIEGHGFGPKPRTILNNRSEGGVDTLGGSHQTSFTINNLGQGAHAWAAGRATETVKCDIGVKLQSWEDNRIVLAGFAGPLGTGCNDSLQIAPGDKLRIVVFGPLNKCGPAGVPECPDEVKGGRVATFETVVVPPSNPTVRTCP